MLSYEVGEWYAEMQTLYELAISTIDTAASLRRDTFIQENLGYKEAFLLACGDLTLAPFHLRKSEDPNIEKIWGTLKEAILDTTFLDHVGFDAGFSSRCTGIIGFPGTGKQTALLTKDVVKKFFTHPWIAASRNPVMKQKFDGPFGSRMPTAQWWNQTQSGTHVSMFTLTEGGCATKFVTEDASLLTVPVSAEMTLDLDNEMSSGRLPDASRLNMVNDPVNYATLNAHQAGITGAAVKGTYNDIGRMRYGLQYLNHGDYILSMLAGGIFSATAGKGVQHPGMLGTGCLYDFHAWTGATVMFDDRMQDVLTTRANSTLVGTGADGGHNASWNIPVTLSLSSPANVYGTQMVRILRKLRIAFPDEVEGMMGSLGRIKKSLPSSSRHTGLGPWGRGYSASVRDGWIQSSAPAWNFEAKLKRASHNGPMLLSSPLSAGTVGHIALSTPTPIDGVGQWGGIDTSCVVSIPDLASGGTFGVTESGLPQRWTGLYMDGVISRFSPPHTTPEMLMGNVSEENKLRADILTYPLAGASSAKSTMFVPKQDSLNLIKEKMVAAGGGGAIPAAFTAATGYWKVEDLNSASNHKDYSSQHWHWSSTFMRGATIRDAVQSGAAGSAAGSSGLFFYDPRQLSLIGGSWYTWAGSYMPAQCWLDPYNPRPFSVTTALLNATDLASLDSKSTSIYLEGDLGELSGADTAAGIGPV
jgi:hypothetical protein